MNFQILKNLVRILCILSLILFAAACEEESGSGGGISGTPGNGATPTPTPGGGTPTPTPVPVGTFKIDLINPGFLLKQNLRMAYRLSGNIPATSTPVLNWDTECSIDPTSTDIEDKNIICYLEGEELDFYANGFKLNVTVDSGTCDYVFQSPYYYFKRQAGVGPTEIRIFRNGDAYEDCTNATYNVNTEDGVPKCQYDHTDIDGPDCCIGTYNKRVFSDANCTVTELPADENADTDAEWDGELSSCLAGPHMSSDYSKIPDGVFKGYPKSIFYKTSGNSGDVELIEYESPIPEETTVIPITITNSFEPNNFGGTQTTMNGAETLYPQGMYDTALETSLIGGGYIGATTTLPHNPYYVWACTDSAQEVKGIIRLVVRDWNETPQFDLEDTGDPDTTGTDIFGFQIDDYYDWDAYRAAPFNREFPNHE